jgi:hypothetical protein
MLYYLFSCCGSIATLPEPQFLLLPTVTCVQSYHVPKSPAEMQKSQLWTLITFFWLCFVTPYFTTNLVYIYIYIYRSFIQSLLRYCAAKKKSFSFFYDPGLVDGLKDSSYPYPSLFTLSITTHIRHNPHLHYYNPHPNPVWVRGPQALALAPYTVLYII